MTPAGSSKPGGPQVFIRLDGAIDGIADDPKEIPSPRKGRTLKLADIADVKPRLRGSGRPS